MAEKITTMFGKAYDTVGSADKNLILQTKGDLKVKWGNKFIDLIKNGKINVDIDFLLKVDSKDSIYKDGIYITGEGEKLEVWLRIGGTLINLLGETVTTYVSFIDKLSVTPELKTMALTNAGFYYETLSEAQEANLTKGIVYILEENQFYYVTENGLIQFKEEFTIPNPLQVGGITIEGNEYRISGGSALSLALGSTDYVSLQDNDVVLNKLLLVYEDILSHDYVLGMSGFAIYYNGDTSQTCAEFDNIKIRGILDYTDTIDITYKKLKELRDGRKLIIGKKYRIIDFQNEWELLEYYHRHNNNSMVFTNTWPITLTADSNKTFRTQGYFCDRQDWIIEYDIDFYYYSHSELNDEGVLEDYYTKGRIAKLTDGFGNSANYDFKHRLFKHTSSSDDPNQWFYTYNILNDKYHLSQTDSDIDPDSYSDSHYYADASELGLITNNVLYIKKPSHEAGVDGHGNSCLKLVLYDQYIIFPNCATIYPYNNQILDSTGKFIITGIFYNNIFKGLYTETDVTFSLEYHDNTFLKVLNCILNAPMQFNIFDNDLQNVNFKCDHMNNNHITGIISTDNNAATYPIEATNFNNNTINNITKTSIKCYGFNVINNFIHNIISYFITNTTLENNEMLDLIGDDSGGGSTPDTPVDPTPGPDMPSGDTNEGIIPSEPTATSVDSKMHGLHTNANPLANTALTHVLLGYIDTVDATYGNPMLYGIYVSEGSNMVTNITFSASNVSGRSFDIYGDIASNLNTSINKIHLWIQFVNVSQLGYINVYQQAGQSGGESGGESGGGDAPTLDGTLDSFISKITGGATGSVKSTVLTGLISAEGTPNTYSYLQSGFNYVSGKSDNLKAWMLANMLAELTPYVDETSGSCYLTDPISGDTATNYFVNAAEHFGGRRLDYLSSEQVYMDRINGAVEYAKFKHANYSSSNSAAAAARTELSGKGISQAAIRTNRTNLVFSREAATHAFPIAPIGIPNTEPGGGDWTFTLSMITQYPTPASAGNTPLLDKELDTNYICNILGLSPSTYADFLNVCNDIGDAGGNPFKHTYARPRPGTKHNLLVANGGSGFTIPNGGSVYLCDCSIEFSDQSASDYDDGYNADCSATNNGETYCEHDIRSFTDITARSDAPNHDNPYKSYQSGHSTRAFMDLLLALEVAGDSMSGGSRTERIHQYCLNRAVVRAHWKSDTIAGRFAASMQIGYLNGYQAFHDKIAAL